MTLAPPDVDLTEIADGPRIVVRPEAQVGDEVTIDGWPVPFLRCWKRDDGSAMLLLDRRFGLEVAADQLDAVIGFVADALAIGAGRTSHIRPFPRDGYERHYAEIREKESRR